MNTLDELIDEIRRIASGSPDSAEGPRERRGEEEAPGAREREAGEESPGAAGEPGTREGASGARAAEAEEDPTPERPAAGAPAGRETGAARPEPPGAAPGGGAFGEPPRTGGEVPDPRAWARQVSRAWARERLGLPPLEEAPGEAGAPGEAPREAEEEARPAAGEAESGPEARDEVVVRPEEFDLEIKVDLGLDEGPGGVLVLPAPPEAPARAPEEEPGEQPPRPRRRRRLVRALVAAALAAAAGAGALWFGLGPGSGDRSTDAGGAAGVPPEQDVVGWAVWDEATESAFVAVVAVGGDREPFLLGIPAYTVVNIPGYGLATVEDAVAVGDPGLASAAVENLLGVRVDAWRTSSLADVAATVDALGGIPVVEGTVDGAGAAAYLSRGSEDETADEFRFLRWLEVAGGILQNLNGRAEALASFPPDVAEVVAAAGAQGAEVVEFPVEDIGANLARPDTEAVEALVAERFGDTGEGVRLVVLNGVGTPGIGERVGRVLVPEGFRLISSLNAPEFDVGETRIIAASGEFVDDAQLAQRLLGVGRVFLDELPTGVADVTVLVGKDFVSVDTGGQ